MSTFVLLFKSGVTWTQGRRCISSQAVRVSKRKQHKKPKEIVSLPSQCRKGPSWWELNVLSGIQCDSLADSSDVGWGPHLDLFGVKTISLCYCIHVLMLKNWIQSGVYTEQMKTQIHPVCRRLCLVSLTMFEFCSACFVLVNEVIYSFFFPFMCKYIYFWCEVNIWIVNVCTDVCGMYFR